MKWDISVKDKALSLAEFLVWTSEPNSYLSPRAFLNACVSPQLSPAAATLRDCPTESSSRLGFFMSVFTCWERTQVSYCIWLDRLKSLLSTCILNSSSSVTCEFPPKISEWWIFLEEEVDNLKRCMLWVCDWQDSPLYMNCSVLRPLYHVFLFPTAGLISEAEQTGLVTKTEEGRWKHTTRRTHTLITVYKHHTHIWSHLSLCVCERERRWVWTGV